MMGPLSLDLLSRRSRAPGAVLLAAALALAVGQGLHLMSLQREMALARQQLVVQAPQRKLAAPPPDDPRLQALRAAVAQANGVVERLALPWMPMFDAVESADDAGIALLALEPDADKRVLGIRGEARNHAALLAYVVRLEKVPFLSGVHLSSHELRLDDPQHPVMFAIAAEWRIEP